MRDDLDKLLCEKFPRMFKERYGSPSATCMCWGFAHGDGWFNIINALCSNIEHHVKWARSERARALVFNRRLKLAIALDDIAPLLTANPNPWEIDRAMNVLVKKEFKEVPDRVEHVVVEQVKEKFGTLRFYYRGGDSYVQGLVSMAESMSGCTCEECGAPGEVSGNGYIQCLCPTHREESDARREMRDSQRELDLR